ncbi:hypothetical protein D7027_02225 [Ochrobactrum intermedium]|uniref:hypothetical protein n=1 Tax=Brucella intermedia TaxID=94625 RepID=UPI00128B411E|nr:hypothetical protein [Brucella intermedia]MPR60649.1 hypothetical protein [Brucella intermedia]
MPDDNMLPEPEFDEFGDKIIRPIESGRSRDGRTIYVKNLDEWTAYEKQLSRNRDARMLERGEIDQAGLIRKNCMFHDLDFSKVRIVAIGDRRYEDID